MPPSGSTGDNTWVAAPAVVFGGILGYLFGHHTAAPAQTPVIVPVASPTPQVITQVVPCDKCTPTVVYHKQTVVHHVTVYKTCHHYPQAEVEAALHQIRNLRHRYATAKDDKAMEILRASCGMTARQINRAIDP